MYLNSLVERHSLNLNFWTWINSLFFLIIGFKRFSKTFSYSLEITDRSEISLYEGESLRGFPRLVIIVISAICHIQGTYFNLNKVLVKSVCEFSSSFLDSCILPVIKSNPGTFFGLISKWITSEISLTVVSLKAKFLVQFHPNWEGLLHRWVKIYFRSILQNDWFFVHYHDSNFHQHSIRKNHLKLTVLVAW